MDSNMVKNQHFIPRCVLKYFKESNDINNKKEKRIYHILHNYHSVYMTTIDRAMAREFYYEIEDFKENSIEKILGRFETSFSSGLNDLVKSVRDYENGCLKFNCMKSKCFQLLKDMMRMHLRSGALVFELGYWVKEDKKRYQIYEMLNRFLNSKYIDEFTSTLIEHYEFCMLKSESMEFLLSDQYMSTAALSFKAQFANSTNRSIGQRDVIVLLPVSKNYYMCFYNGNVPNYINRNRLIKLKNNEAHEINKVIINNSYLETVGSSKKPLEISLEQYIERSPIGIYYGGDNFSAGSELRKEVFFYDSDLSIYEFIRQPYEWVEYRNLKKNDLCACGSGRTYGSCCRYKVRAVDKFMKYVENQDSKKGYSPYMISGCNFIERNITDFYRRI